MHEAMENLSTGAEPTPPLTETHKKLDFTVELPRLKDVKIEDRTSMQRDLMGEHVDGSMDWVGRHAASFRKIGGLDPQLVSGYAKVNDQEKQAMKEEMRRLIDEDQDVYEEVSIDH